MIGRQPYSDLMVKKCSSTNTEKGSDLGPRKSQVTQECNLLFTDEQHKATTPLTFDHVGLKSLGCATLDVLPPPFDFL